MDSPLVKKWIFRKSSKPFPCSLMIVWGWCAKPTCSRPLWPFAGTATMAASGSWTMRFRTVSWKPVSYLVSTLDLSKDFQQEICVPFVFQLKKMCQNLVWPCTIGFPCHTFHPVFRGPIRRCIIGDRPAALDHPIWPGFGGLGVQWFWWKPQHGDHDRFGSVLLDHQDTWCYWSIDDGPQCISNAEGDWVDQSLHLVLLLVNFICPKVLKHHYDRRKFRS